MSKTKSRAGRFSEAQQKTDKQIIAEIKASEPVGQSFHSGKWGFERVYDCLNLNRCVYPTEHSAKIARHKAAVIHLSMLNETT